MIKVTRFPFKTRELDITLYRKTKGKWGVLKWKE